MVEISRKKGIKCLISPTTENPGFKSIKNNYRWAFGDIENIEEVLQNNTFMNDMCVEANPFETSPNGIAYTGKFKDIKAYKKATTGVP